MKRKTHQLPEYIVFGSGPAVLLIHDYPSGRDLPEGPCKTLAEAGYRVILTPLPETGTAAAIFDPGSHALKVVALLNHLGIGRAVIFGIGIGGYVLFELMEKYPRRIAASSLIVGPMAAKDIRKLVSRPDIQASLKKGRLDELKQGCLAALSSFQKELSPAAAMNQLCTWAGRVCKRNLRTGSGRVDIEIPPLLEKDGGSRPRRSLAASGRQTIRGLNLHLLALVNFILPGEEEEDMEEELADIGLR